MLAVFHQEATRLRRQGADEFELVLGQAEADAVVLVLGAGVGHEDLRRRLLDDGRGDAAVERVPRRLRAEPQDGVALAQRLHPITDAGGEDLVVERLPAFIDHDQRRLAVEALLYAMEEVHHRRRTQDRVLEQRRHVETEGAGGGVQPVDRVVEQPGMLAPAHPWGEPGRQVAFLRAPPASQKFDEIPWPAISRLLLVVGRHRRGDGRLLLRRRPLARLAHQTGDQRSKEGALDGRSFVLHRIEAGGLARTQHRVVAADRPQEDLRAAVLVEEHGARSEPRRLRHQEVQHHGLAGT